MCPPPAGATRLWEAALPKPMGSNTSAPDCVPRDDISQAAYEYAAQHLHPDILNHSLRVYLLSMGLAIRQDSPYSTVPTQTLLFAACILHDIGTCDIHNGPQRFEVEGADAAKTFLVQHGVQDSDVHDVWVAIAVHASPGIAENIAPLARLVRLGVAMDFKRPAALRLVRADEIQKYEERFPRGEIEKVLGDVVVEQVMSKERDGEGEEAVMEKACAASWAGLMVRSKRENPGYEGVNKAF